MDVAAGPSRAVLSGRIRPTPSGLLHEQVLEPQFRYEVKNLLSSYLAIEKVMLVEYIRMGVLTAPEADQIAQQLDRIDEHSLTANPEDNLSDIAFAIERQVAAGLESPVPRWHVDRSRNDFQSCAQLMWGRSRLLRSALLLADFGASVRALALRGTELPMPGYSHFQAAQVITPGFHFAALGEQIVHSGQRLLATYNSIDACPLGAGAMAGQELPWDRGRMAALLGFSRVKLSALSSVASRDWALEATAELALIGAALSRFATDLLTWGSSEYGFIDLPDELSGISSAMPQKKNFPVLERIRGRTAHLGAFHFDAMLGQRNTPFSNLVEVSKEAGAHTTDCFDTFDSILSLFMAVTEGISFKADRMRAACEREFLGGFSLANELTLSEAVPWRTAQVIAGRYIVAASSAGLQPGQGAPDLLLEAAERQGIVLREPSRAIAGAFDIDAALRRLRSSGAAHPDAVREAIAVQEDEQSAQIAQWQRHQDRGRLGTEETARLLRLSHETTFAGAREQGEDLWTGVENLARRWGPPAPRPRRRPGAPPSLALVSCCKGLCRRVTEISS